MDDLLDLCQRSGKPDKEQRTAKRMVALLMEDLPANGPRGNLSKHLDEHILEFRRGPKHGKQLRVTYFYGSGRRVIVCARWFFKREKTPPGEIHKAIELRDEYLLGELKRTNTIDEF
jgi:Phage derived protein Gp49-like (DUF891)